MLGVLIVILGGLIIILLGALVPTLVPRILRNIDAHSHRWLSWTLDHNLQQMRMAQEGAGWGGTWQNQVGSRPVTQKGHLLGRYEFAEDEAGMEVAGIERFVDNGGDITPEKKTRITVRNNLVLSRASTLSAARDIEG